MPRYSVPEDLEITNKEKKNYNGCNGLVGSERVLKWDRVPPLQCYGHLLEQVGGLSLVACDVCRPSSDLLTIIEQLSHWRVRTRERSQKSSIARCSNVIDGHTHAVDDVRIGRRRRSKIYVAILDFRDLPLRSNACKHVSENAFLWLLWLLLLLDPIACTRCIRCGLLL